ncbi:uncharacterized protein JCM15063_000585 [Sporobolomyces koalae]|uniref:uncharacterized protein n=1 Tax=Sporobolomyces koalae TaxID=500713 RepID=UPI00317E564E
MSKRKDGGTRIKAYKNYRLRFGVIDLSPAALDTAKAAKVNYVAGFDGYVRVPDTDDLPETDKPRIGGFFDGYPPAFLHLAENWFIVTAALSRGSTAWSKSVEPRQRPAVMMNQFSARWRNAGRCSSKKPRIRGLSVIGRSSRSGTWARPSKPAT